MLLKQSTARNKQVFMTDSADHVTGKTGLTLTITANKDGAAFASIAPAVTERGDGWYSVALTAAHTDTLGDLALHITAAGADPTDLVWQVVLDLPGASVSSVTGNVGGNVVGSVGSVTGNVDGNVTGSVGSVVGAVGSVTGLTAANLDVAVSTRAAPGDSMGLDPAAVDAIWDEILDSGYTGRQLVRGFASALMARLSGADVNAPVFRDLANTKNRITATTDASGNRTAVTLDLT
jgi:hypothetical protein